MAFESTTTSFSGAPMQRAPFVWTYSDLKNWRDCKKRHYHYKMAKVLGNLDDAIREPISEQLQKGFDMHSAMAKRVKNNVPLPPAFQQYEPYAAKFCSVAAKFPGSKILAEEKWGITRDYKQCEYFNAPNLWFRQVADAVILCPNDGIALNWDWKTGKPQQLKGYKDDPIQVLLGAACLFLMYPWLQGVRNELIWVEYDMTTQAMLTREEMPMLWASILPEVNAMEADYYNMNYPPKRGFLCAEWCAVESCVHHGKSGRD